MSGDDVTLGEIARSCARIEGGLSILGTKVERQGERQAEFAERLAALESRGGFGLRPTAITAGSSAGVVAVIEAVRHFWR